MNIAWMIGWGWLVMAAVMALLWLVQRRTGNAGIVDVAWPAGVGVLGAFFCLSSETGNPSRCWLVAILILVWALRLSGYIWLRVRKEPEDGRYVELKRRWGAAAPFRMFRFYQMQALGAVAFALPMLVVAYNASPLGWLDALAGLIWIVAIVGESIADRQLARFKARSDSAGRVCQEGLWRYSRHPNYFFEWLHWWAYVCFAWWAPWGFLTVVAPLAMLHFVLNVTGIPPTEKQALLSRGEAYRQYQQTTSAFFPWFRKKEQPLASAGNERLP